MLYEEISIYKIGDITTDNNGQVKYGHKLKCTTFGHIQPYVCSGILKNYGIKEEYKKMLYIESILEVPIEINDIIVTKSGNFRVVEIPWDIEHWEVILDVYNKTISS